MLRIAVIFIFILCIVSCDDRESNESEMKSYRACHLFKTDGLCNSAHYSEVWVNEDTIAIVYDEGGVRPLLSRYFQTGDTLNLSWPSDTMIFKILFKEYENKLLIRNINFSDENDEELVYEPFTSEIQINNFRELYLKDVYERSEEYNCVCDSPMYEAPSIETPIIIE